MRLIDADKIKEFADYYTTLEVEPLTEREQLLVTCVCEKIRELMPTAYDVNKVKERIKEEIGACECKECGKYCGNCDACREEKAMEIVKSGFASKEVGDD